MNLTEHWKSHNLLILSRIKEEFRRTDSLTDQVSLLELHNAIRDDLNYADKILADNTRSFDKQVPQ